MLAPFSAVVPEVGDADALYGPAGVDGGVAVVAADAPAVAGRGLILFIADTVFTAEGAGQQQKIAVGVGTKTFLIFSIVLDSFSVFGIWGGVALLCGPERYQAGIVSRLLTR